MAGRFIKDGIFVIDREHEFVSLMFNDKKQQEKCVNWLNNTVEHVNKLEKEVDELKVKIDHLESKSFNGFTLPSWWK